MNRREIPGLFSNGAAAEMIVRAPEVNPADPIPAMALPTIRAFEEGAVAHTSDPSSKRARNAKKVYYSGKVNIQWSGKSRNTKTADL